MPGSLRQEGRSVSDASHAVLAMGSDALRAIRKDGFLLYRRFRNVSIARKLYFTVGTMALLIGVELFVLLFCLNTLSSLRAYVGGEGLWSKAQKDAVFHLYKYGVSHTDKDYELFERFMRIPAGDAQTRRELLAGDGNMDAARQGFLEGRNHPDDIDGMIHLFIRFGNVSYIRKAISVWGDAQAMVMQLPPIAERLHAEINSPNPSQERVNELLASLYTINEKLTALEDEFSFTLGEGSRWLERVVIRLLFVTAITVETTGLLLVISVTRGIQRGLTEIIRAANSFSAGELSARTKVLSHDEIGIVASSFNEMAYVLEIRVTELAAARSEAEHAYQAKSKFLAAASHDLRQPVQSLVLLMALIERQIAANPEARSTLAMMQKALDGLNSLLTAILDVSRLDAGVEAHPEPVDLAAMLRRLALEYQPKADKVGLVLRVAAPGLWASADPALLERAIRNLIDNAIRYTRTGGVLLGLRRRNGHGRVRIDVVDTGIGIPRERQADIFEEFVQISNPGRHLGLGLGLGLAIVARIAKLIGATIEVSSNVGRGSRFSLLLPVADATYAATEEDASKFEDPGGRVLIIEDNAIVLQSLETALAQWGYETVAASTGEEALRVAEDECWRFGAILTDEHLGAGLNGVDTVREIVRRSKRFLPALILTGDTSTEGISEIAASGFQIMHKPIAPEALRRNLARLLSE
jgi:signal transduction histidine kinase/CheY-like chemotaxis protein